MSEQGIPAQGIDVTAHVRVNTLQPLQLTGLNRFAGFHQHPRVV